MANSGSSLSEQTVVNTNEYIYQIAQGQIMNYVWNATTSSWVPMPATVPVTTTPSYQIGTMSGVALGSGNMVSGGYTSASLTANQPLYYKNSMISTLSGTASAGTAFLVTLIPAQGGFASGVVLVSAAFITASVLVNPPSSPFILMSGDAIVTTTVSNANSGFTWNTRTIFSQ
jgi:hypothetical protein